MSVDQDVYNYLFTRLDKNSIVVDIGAYTGNISKLLCESSGGSPTNYYLIEPCPENFKVLSNNCKNYNLFNIAITSRSGTIKLYIANHKKSDGSSQGNSIHKGFVEKNEWCKNIIQHDAKCTTLDMFLEENNIDAIDFLKINCEGGEYEIFSSDTDFLSKTNYLYLQLHGKYKKFITKDAINKKMSIVNKLKDTGFQLILGDNVKDIPNIKKHVHQLWRRHGDGI